MCLLSVLNGKLTNYDVTKPSSDYFPTFLRTVPFVRRRKRAIFNVEYLGDVLMKSRKTLDYDYFDYNLSFWVKIKPGPISLHLTFKVSTERRAKIDNREMCVKTSLVGRWGFLNEESCQITAWFVSPQLDNFQKWQESKKKSTNFTKRGTATPKRT